MRGDASELGFRREDNIDRVITSSDDCYRMLTASNFKVSSMIMEDPNKLATRTDSAAGQDKADIVKKFPVVYPKDKQEQSRIAEALSDIDKLIASLSKMIEKKRLMKQGAMQQLLTGKKRLPGFEGEWENVYLGNIADIRTGKRNGDEATPTGKYCFFVRSQDIFRIDDYSYDGEAILIPGEGGIGSIFHYINGKFDYHQRVYKISDFSKNYCCKFVYYYLQQYFGAWAQMLTVKATVDSLRLDTFKNFKMYIPNTYNEQSAIANILTTMDNEIESLEEERDKYIRVKEGMMQKLLTGQIRLVETEAKVVAMPKAKGANVHFKRSVLAAEIANRLCEEPTFGHVKMEKLIFLTEHLCHIDTGSHYHRDAAGPYDNTALRSIDKQMKQHQWFALTKKDKGYRYQPMDKRGDHKKYFDKYYASVLPMFDKVIETFKTSSTEQCEIVATLYSAWNDLLHRSQPFTDDDILNEVLNHWHDSKKRISSSRWQKALDWMRKNGFVPTLGNNN
jgi:type I restriction enzyme S subunit